MTAPVLARNRDWRHNEGHVWSCPQRESRWWTSRTPAFQDERFIQHNLGDLTVGWKCDGCADFDPVWKDHREQGK